MDIINLSSNPLLTPRKSNPSSEDDVQRRIIAEDPEWNLAPVHQLSDLCVRVIVANFDKR